MHMAVWNCESLFPCFLWVVIVTFSLFLFQLSDGVFYRFIYNISAPLGKGESNPYFRSTRRPEMTSVAIAELIHCQLSFRRIRQGSFFDVWLSNLTSPWGMVLIKPFNFFDFFFHCVQKPQRNLSRLFHLASQKTFFL